MASWPLSNEGRRSENQSTFDQYIVFVATIQKPIRQQFTIRDLENMSGIKAHTIRMWEKRYNLFDPQRAGNNVRYYSQDDLRKWLNVSSLYHLGYKISAIAEMSETVLRETVQHACVTDVPHPVAHHAFMLAMLTFDTSLFSRTFKNLVDIYPFGDVYRHYLVPLLERIGFMWQTGTVTIAHEHFLSNLIRQKLYLEAEKIQFSPIIESKEVFVLFLPENEIHELGLLFVHYELLRQGHRSIYLGQSVPLKALCDLQGSYSSIIFVSSFTVEPGDDHLIAYLKEASHLLLRKGQDELRVSGQKIQKLDKRPSIPGIRYILPGEPIVP